MRRSLLLALSVLLASAGTSGAVPSRVAEQGTVPQRTHHPARDVCAIGYYDMCSGWVWYWTFSASSTIRYGTCFDLGDCPGNCRHLTDLWFALKRFTARGAIDIEMYCADAYGCPIGPPFVGIYDWPVSWSSAWKHLVFQNLELCPCQEVGPGNLAVILTDHDYGANVAPYTDRVPTNVQAGCGDWKCVGHSYLYTLDANYCDLYGQPREFFVSGSTYGCTHPVYGQGVYADLLMDIYVACLGPTATEKDSWSAIKSLYR